MEKIENIDINLINNSSPSNLKTDGINNIGNLILNQGNIINNNLIPKILQFSSKLNIQNIGEPNEILPDICVNKTILDNIIIQRNNLVFQLNNIYKKLNSLTSTIDELSSFSDILTSSLTSLYITKTALSISTKLLPTTPGLITSTLSDLEDLKTNLIFDNEGVSKISKINNTISFISLSSSIVGLYIKKIIGLLNSIDTVLKKCLPLSPLEIIDNGLINTYNQINNTLNIQDNQYKGFIFEVETVPFSPTVNRIRVLAKNSQGITMLQSELSFANDSSILIDELKFIIDRDKLKSY